ncbi:MAG: pilin [Patescibacteria group bacterium]|jgi:hypothetical protein
MQNSSKFLTATALCLLLFAPLATAQATTGFRSSCDTNQIQGFGAGLRRVACDAGLISSAEGGDSINEDTIIQIFGSVISLVFGFVGVVFAVLTIYGGYLWMTARGNEEQVQQSQNYIRNSVIGIIIVLAAFSITQFIIARLISAVSQTSVL